MTGSFEVVNGKQATLLVAPLLVFVLACLAVGARWYTRSVRRVNTLTEDALCLLALAMSFCIVTIVYVMVFRCGEGLVLEDIKNDPTKNYNHVHRYWVRMQFAFDTCWATSVVIVQLAYMKFYIRLYEGRTFIRCIWYFLMLCICIWYVWSIIKWSINCHPPGKCVMQNKYPCIITGSLHAFFNAVILVGSLPIVYYAELCKKKKWWFAALFLLGCFCLVLAVLRMDCAFEVFGDVQLDPIGASWWRICFSPIEVAVGIICCCVPGLENFWCRDRSALPSDGTGLRRLKFRTTSGSSSTSNLNPAHWRFDLPKAQVNTFVTLENASKSMERVGDLGPHEIKVTKDYQLNRDRV